MLSHGDLIMKFKKRIGLHPHAAGQNSSGKTGCPDIWELDNGKFAVIGVDATELLQAVLPDDAGCGPDERIVVIDRHILINAKSDIPAT
jgi:hypothetical protein